MSDLLLEPGRTLGVVGAGVMGTALLKGILDHGLLLPKQAWAATKTEASSIEVAGSLGIRAVPAYESWVPSAGILLIAVKPGQAAKVIEKLKLSGLREDTLLISVLAGVTTETFETLLGRPQPVIRAMPNTPCLVGHGVTVYCGGKGVEARHLAIAERIFHSVGQAREVEEHYFNAITALSGSGPAYMYLVMESLADAGVRVGLPRDLAMTLVAQTMMGSAKMVQETGRHPAALRDDVTTPAGCTIGGLLMLEDGKIRSVLARAVEEATKIVEQLGKSKS
ncbi:pyrroline-5-carboxylate reductase [Bryobacter aggregatus]|uniref:pyrroline-5-carboxylate reductase n=1 Tax=Bryobacter aggregatus TaxID=360054 RepID=UPI0004E2234E|nr:pyrroline-5-carboxylate reductase [Bryobacter aggregatus]